MRKLSIFFIVLFFAAVLSAGGRKEPFHKTVDYIDLNRFTGDWYVIAVIPTPFEKRAANGIENYSLDKNGNIRVEYTFHKDSPEGKVKVMHQKGWIYNKSTNADWRVQPLWPLKLPYYIIEIGPDYEYTVIATDSYKYLWIMARIPAMETEDLNAVIERMKERGFNSEKIQIMIQKWE